MLKYNNPNNVNFCKNCGSQAWAGSFSSTRHQINAENICRSCVEDTCQQRQYGNYSSRECGKPAKGVGLLGSNMGWYYLHEPATDWDEKPLGRLCGMHFSHLLRSAEKQEADERIVAEREDRAQRRQFDNLAADAAIDEQNTQIANILGCPADKVGLERASKWANRNNPSIKIEYEVLSELISHAQYGKL